MSRVAICTDSSALFAPGVAERLGVSVVPIGISLDGEAYASVDADDFYSRLSAGASEDLHQTKSRISRRSNLAFTGFDFEPIIIRIRRSDL